MQGNTVNPRGLGAHTAIAEAAFRKGVDDFRGGRPFADDLPPLTGCKDTICNRQRLYETGRLVAAFARAKRRKITAATAVAAKKEGYIPWTTK